MTYFGADLTEPGGGGPRRPDIDLEWVQPEPAGHWSRSSYSYANGNCVEVRGLGRDVEVRDSKNPGGGVLRMSRDEWLEFLTGVRSGRLRFGA